MAAEGGQEEVVEVLLHHKADCSLVTDTGLDGHDACDHIGDDHDCVFLDHHRNQGNINSTRYPTRHSTRKS